MLFGEEACLAPFGRASFGEGCFCAAGSGDVGAAGALCPIDTEMPNSRHCPLMGRQYRPFLRAGIDRAVLPLG